MLRIQKAVLKAKGAKENQPVRSAAELAQSPLEQLRYTTTRVDETHPDKLADNRVIAGFNNNPISQTFRTLRTQVIQKMRENNWQSLAITSPTEGEGKTTIAANLAVAIAMEVNQTVLLVDLDLKRPALADQFGISCQKGFRDYLKGDVELEEIMVNPGIERLVVIPGRGTVNNSSEIISGPKMVSFFNESKTRYSSRFVIYDMPAILPSDDVLTSVGNIDCALLVIEDGKNPEKEIVRAVRQLKNTAVLGTVLNRYHKGSWLL